MENWSMETPSRINAENIPQTITQNPSELTLGSACTENAFQYPALFTSKSFLELSTCSWSRGRNANENIQPYLRGCKWSPDGTCCLSVVNNDGVHVTELPSELYQGVVCGDRIIDVLESVIHLKETGSVYDFCWYPFMNSTNPPSCCWLTTKQNSPIQMWDAFDGSLRCSYRGFNAVDEMEPALSVSFTSDGRKIIAGYKKHLRIFDVERPGREFTEQKISSSASSISTQNNLVAVGSWNTTITLYNESEIGTKKIGDMYGHGGGVTHMKFIPGTLKLVSGARKDHRLFVWDIRYYRKPLNILSRVVNTNQRIYFDISPCGRYLVSGGTDGVVKVWSLDHIDWHSSLDPVNNTTDDVTYKFPLYKDCCNSISIHPYRPILATGSGQYHFTDPIKSLSEKTNNEAVDSSSDDSINQYDIRYSSHSENCLTFWWTGDVIELNKNLRRCV